MSITVANTLSFVNDALKRSETDIYRAINLCVEDLAKLNFLVKTITTTGTITIDALESGDTYIDYPTRYKEMISLVLNDGTYDGEPLRAIPGGMHEYEQWMEDETSSDYDEPEWYTEYDSKIYLYHPSDGAYTPTLKGYFYHQTVDESNGIEFGDEFENAVYYGSTFFVACLKNLISKQGLWGGLYANEKIDMETIFPREPYICGK